ncbi:MFS transporter [Halomonas organivorans]|uniref:Putative MFS family arabinose efflux permease n=1 Tax=Halomonas organivorans TaxID=257772 RepID=A0A7W5G4G1_9GAMM|nr:MFS transporter [Halomonas organivorans]MBB3139925.1 putative MFS family arabinose efflux permease [Halomonas organivorans]
MTARSTILASEQKTAAWGAVFSMSLCVAMLIAAEFMPVSLLTPIADGLGATEGQTGQAVSISGFFAVAASLLMTTLAGRLNRKWVLLTITTLMLVSLALMASAPSFAVLMLSRALLGVCIGGFWSLATAVIMRLVEVEHVSRALAIMYTGQAIAAAFAAPIGSYLGGIIGWRGVFWVLVPIVAVNLVWQWATLPSLPASQRQTFRSLKGVLTRSYFARGIVAAVFGFAGAFSMFTYLRPFLEGVTGVDVTMLSALFLVLGCAGFLGTWAGGKFASQRVVRLLQAVPLLMGLSTLGLLGFGQQLAVVAVLLAIWGAMNTVMSIAWMSWLSQNVDDAPEAAGSLIVAAIQAAILLGAAFGGWLLDHLGIQATFIGSAVLCAASLLLIGSGRRLLKPD